jgi:hypothetical protein
MLSYVPLFVTLVFLATVLITGIFLVSAIIISYKRRSEKTPLWIIALLLIWLAIQGLLAHKGFYTNTSAMPPRAILAIGPPLLFIFILFKTTSGKQLIENLPLPALTYLHTIRILVEVVLYWLFLSKAVPGIMTFAGRNFDIIAGITAPAIGYLYFRQKMLSSTILLVWNVCCILLLVNIVTIAILSAPFPFQQLAFDQPSIAMEYFPFVWLPSFIVPVVLFSHLASIRQLWKNKL